ncbi:amidase family protein [Tateyamaria armeniaca]|uniref:Amidase family protein n=1 Tax=Tateyamaria armeniaca TaxID=2518930 RepID=A0ABW8US56_9RHOB
MAIAALNAMADLNPLVRSPFTRSAKRDGPLAGVPVVVKANIAIEGLPHCGASPALVDNIASRSAPAVERLLEAGAVIVGQSNMHELAFGITSHNLHHGPVGNPANPAHMAGGSSGGTAAAVAGGAVPMGLASDTGGSGRLPAAMCGCVGFRPTYGRYPGQGVLTLSTSFDTITPMARDVAGIAQLDAVLAGSALKPLAEKKNMRLGVVDDALLQGVDAQMQQACRAKLDGLAERGVELVPLSSADLLEQCGDIALGIVLYETKHFWTRFLSARHQDLADFPARIASPDVAGIFQMIVDEAAPSDAEYADMVGPKREAIRDTVSALLDGLDGLVMPTLPTTAPKIGDTDTCQINGEAVDLFTAMTRRAAVASITGNPSISVPAGRLNGLPIGLEVIGRHGGDLDLLGVATRLEELLEAST